MIQENTNINKRITAATATVINIKGLCKSFGKILSNGKASNDVLKGVDLTVKKGENLVVLGKSGSGKSITIKCLVGLIVPDKGEINVLGTDITGLNYNELNAI